MRTEITATISRSRALIKNNIGVLEESWRILEATRKTIERSRQLAAGSLRRRRIQGAGEARKP